jgi:hypothetical protein
MESEYISYSQDISTLVKDVDELIRAIKTLNLTNIEALKKADSILNALSFLDIETHLLPCLGWDIDSAYALRQIANRIIDDAKDAKILLRKAALKSCSEKKADSVYVDKIAIVLVNINLSLFQLTSELYGLKNLPLFSFTNKITK